MEAPRGAEAKKKPQHLEGDELYKALIAGSVGNFLEWFDFALYGMFANEIAATFFPAGEASTQLLESFAVFAGAFVMRPVGGVLFGYIGDKYGRVYSMRLAMSLMAVPTTAIAILPGYETLGIISTALLVLIRLIQGLSVGGAFGGLMTYAMEITPPHRVGFVSALLKVFSAAGTLVGSLVAALMHTIYTDQELLDWAWRLPFALGIFVSVVGIWMRRGLREATQFEEAKASGELVSSAAGLGSGLWRIAPAIVRVIVVINLNNIGFLPAYLTNARYWCQTSGCEWLDDSLKEQISKSPLDPAMTPDDLFCVAATLDDGKVAAVEREVCEWVARPMDSAYSLNAIFMCYVLAVEVWGGMLSDRRGSPDAAMAVGAVGVMIFTPVAFYFYAEMGGVWSYVLGCAPVGGFLGLYIGPMTWWMSTQLPDVATRNTAMGLTYNVAAMISGASPAVATAIVSNDGTGTNNVMWVGYMTSVIAFVSVVCLCVGPGFSMRGPGPNKELPPHEASGEARVKTDGEGEAVRLLGTTESDSE